MTYFIIFYPGFISWDFYVQWHEMSGRIPLTDWHPVFHTLAILLLTKIWNSPAIISLVQIAAMSFLVGVLVKKIIFLNASKIVLVFTIIFYAFFPLNGFYAVSLWKDIGYSISFLWFILVLLSIYSSEGKDLLKTGILIQLFVSLLFVSLMRHNGIIPAFGTLLILYLLHSRHYFYRIFIVTIFFVLSIIIFKTIIFNILEVDTNNKNVLKAHLPIQHIGSILNDNKELLKNEKEFLSNIIPLDYWRKAYRPKSCMPLIFGKNKKGDGYLNRKFMENDGNYKKFLYLWISLSIKYYGSIIKYYKESSELLWLINSKYKTFIIPDEDITEEHLHSGYKPSAQAASERAGVAGKKLVKIIKNNKYGWITHRGAIYFWLSLFFIYLLFIRFGKNILIFSAPMLLQSITVAAFPLVQDTRFMFPIILTTPVYIAVYFSLKKV